MPVFADTFYWVALANPGDARHQQALQAEAASAVHAIATTDEVLGEFLTFFSGHAWLRQRAAATVKLLRADPAVVVLPQSRESFDAGLALYDARPDKQYSWVDCVSMAAMRLHRITDVLTNDRHFEQQGFRILFPASRRCWGRSSCESHLSER